MHFGVPLRELVREAFRDLSVSPPRTTECHEFPQDFAIMQQNFSEMLANPRSFREPCPQNHEPTIHRLTITTTSCGDASDRLSVRTPFRVSIRTLWGETDRSESDSRQAV